MQSLISECIKLWLQIKTTPKMLVYNTANTVIMYPQVMQVNSVTYIFLKRMTE